jgi:hypothetical protein
VRLGDRRPDTVTIQVFDRQGWPIASGVIEGVCRHLIADRFDLAGARWGLAGAEAMLKLNAASSGAP